MLSRGTETLEPSQIVFQPHLAADSEFLQCTTVSPSFYNQYRPPGEIDPNVAIFKFLGCSVNFWPSPKLCQVNPGSYLKPQSPTPSGETNAGLLGWVLPSLDFEDWVPSSIHLSADDHSALWGLSLGCVCLGWFEHRPPSTPGQLILPMAWDPWL